jgi:TolB-like protein
MIRSRWLALSVAFAAAVVAPSVVLAATNVAVFNFQMTTDTPEWRWLEKGLADRIATDFVRAPGLAVVARDEMQLVAQKMNWVPEMATTDAARMGEIRKALKIEQLISGVYAVADGRIRITGQIVDVESRMELARKEVEGPVEEVLNLQRQLSAELLAWFMQRPPAEILATLPVWTRSLPAARALYEGMDLYDQGRYGEGCAGPGELGSPFVRVDGGVEP